MNQNLIPNEISSDFFLPFIGSCGIMFSGTGKQVLLKNLNASCYEKNSETGEIKSCDCCVIY